MLLLGRLVMAHVSFTLSSPLSTISWSTVLVTLFIIHWTDRALLLPLSGSCILPTVHQTVSTCNYSIPPVPFLHCDLYLENNPAAGRVEIGLRSVIFSWHWRRDCGLRKSRRCFLLCGLKHTAVAVVGLFIRCVFSSRLVNHSSAAFLWSMTVD
jgi:hypothetical protein